MREWVRSVDVAAGVVVVTPWPEDDDVMRFDVLTIFPAVFPGPLGVGVVGRAIEAGSVELHVHDLREHTADRHRQVDDMQFGGGGGMVLKPEPIIRAVRALRDEVPGLRTILLSPQGRVFTQDVARELAGEPAVLLVCGRYQGVDERAREEIGEELSVGDYVLSGGEVGAMAVIEATARLVPGVVGSPESLDEETFSSTVERRPGAAAVHASRGVRGPRGAGGAAQWRPRGDHRMAPSTE